MIAIITGLAGFGVLTYLIAQGSENKPAETPIRVQQRTDVVRFDNGVTVYLDDDPRVEIEAEVLGGQSRLLEFLVVGHGGPAHEALLKINARCHDIHQGLEILGLKAGEKKLANRGDNAAPEGAPVDIELTWKTVENKAMCCPVEDWVIDTQSGKAMERGPWVFTGSIAEYREEFHREIYLADQLNILVALWRDPGAVINNPREHGSLADAYVANGASGVMPAPETRVTMVLRAHNDKPR